MPPSHAKLNLFLEITGKRPDGYHNLESVFLEITLRDEIHIYATPNDKAITLACDTPDIPGDETNLAVKAAETLRKKIEQRHPPLPGLHIELRKNIPCGAGLGGGSSNAATTLALANHLWNGGLNTQELAETGTIVGSDVPFFCHGGTCLCRGRGEIVEKITSFPKKVEIGLALPSIHSNTGEAFSRLNLPPKEKRKTAGPFIEAMRAGDVEGMTREAFNRFEGSVFAAKPELAGLHGELGKMLGREVRMSGTGSALWFFANDFGGDWEKDRDIARWAKENRVALKTVRAVGSDRGERPTFPG